MKRNSKGAKKRSKTIQVWTLTQARSAAPYLTSILRSLREHTLEASACRHREHQIDARPGRPDRDALIAMQESDNAARRARRQRRPGRRGTGGVDIQPLDPIHGQALVPFVHEEQLAWYVFDLFDPQLFRFWPFQSDPDDTRRPLTPRKNTAASRPPKRPETQTRLKQSRDRKGDGGGDLDLTPLPYGGGLCLHVAGRRLWTYAGGAGRPAAADGISAWQSAGGLSAKS